MDVGVNETGVDRKHFAGSEPTAQHLTEPGDKLIYLLIEPIILKRKALYLYV